MPDIVSPLTISDFWTYSGLDLVAFTGTGTFDALPSFFVENDLQSFTPGANALLSTAGNSSITSFTGSTVTVRYVYEAAPPPEPEPGNDPIPVTEPGSLALLATGAGFLLRRRYGPRAVAR